jgi:allene oxide cyclase-like protein
MKRLLSTLFAVGIVTVLVVAVTASAGSKEKWGHHWGTKTITVVEHATTDTTTDNVPLGDSPGDVLTFANEEFDETDTRKVGTNQGYCIRVVVGKSYECNWTNLLPGGQITVEGPFYDADDSVLAITGGTGRYRKARGEMKLIAVEGDPTKFKFVFHITR